MVNFIKLMVDHQTSISNVLVIGSGGAGLRAAIEAKLSGLTVYVLGKRSKHDPHTVMAAGGINASFGNVDYQDSWQQHFADTYLEGYRIGNPELIAKMAKEAPSAVNEIDQWGANFQKLKNGNFDQRFFGAHTYRRTCYAGDYTGLSIQKSLVNKAEELKISIFDSEYVTDLLIDEQICFGALSFNTLTGEKTVHISDAVILCTGGHTRIWKKSSSRKQENTGDGMHLALKAGCKLIDMEMVQFHPTGMLFPDEFEGYLVTEAVRGEGGILRNGYGERFMNKYDENRMELSTRDRIAFANYTEIEEGRTSPNGGVFLDISHLDKDLIIKKLPQIYRQFIELQSLDISKTPMEVAPTAHYSMGGIEVETLNHSTKIKGLFAAGEVSGGLHGANRLGGNSLAEILIFGKITGKAASAYSKNLKIQKRSQKVMFDAITNINSNIKRGNELAITLQRELKNLMWKYCGVVKNETKLRSGLKVLDQLKIRSKEVEVVTDERSVQDLVNVMNLKSSLITAEATLLASLSRKESRGAHQRSDYPHTLKTEELSYKIYLNNNLLKVEKGEKIKLDNDLNKYIKNKKISNNFKGKLLE